MANHYLDAIEEIYWIAYGAYRAGATLEETQAALGRILGIATKKTNDTHYEHF